MVLCLEDVHWADPDTLELLWFLARGLSGTPILMIASIRTEDIHRDHPLFAMLPRLQHDCPTEVLRLDEVSVEDTAELIESRSGPCTRELAVHLHTRSQGNPFYVVELLRDLLEQRRLERDSDGRWLPPANTAGVPSIVQHIILHRVARLGDDVEHMLRVAAVVGAEWQLNVVEHVLRWDETRLLRSLDSALTAHVIVPGSEIPETYVFAHALIREVLYAQSIVRRRKQLHEQVGTALETMLTRDDDAAGHAAIAYQFASAENWPKAMRYATSAGDWSRARYATHTALRLYELAGTANSHLDPSSSDADAAATTIRLHERIGKLHMILNQQDMALAAFTRMRELSRQQGEVVAEGEALVWRSAICSRINRMVEARESAREVLELSENTDDRRLRALANRSMGHLRLLVGDDIKQATAHLELGAQLARDGQHLDALGTCLYELAMLATFRGDYRAAERLGEEALALASANREVGLCASACFSLGVARIEHGRFQAALQVLRLGIDTASEAGEQRYIAKLMNTMTGLHDDLGDFSSAREWARRALETARGGHDGAVLEAERYALAGAASVELHAGDLSAAQGYLDELESLLDVTLYARFRYLNRYQLLRGELALARRDFIQARHWADEARVLAESKGVRKNVARGRLLSGRALAGTDALGAAEDDLRKGLAIADAVQNATLSWQGRFWLAQALEVRRSSEAKGVYAEAQQRIDAVAAGLVDPLLRECFVSSTLVQQVHQCAAGSGVRTLKTSHPAGLTAREVEVLRLVASGATNAHIAEALSISPRTVDVHMSSILTRTGCANRAAAVAFAVRHGLT
jgi:DNA-binding CsgD family transcriptional regulator/tetratricopeptide (TPR) repeat protein